MPKPEQDQAQHSDLLRLTAEIASAYVGENEIESADLPDMIKSVYAVLAGAGSSGASAASRPPAVPVSKSIKPSHIICLEDGRKLKMLKRHIRTAYGLTPDQYRAKWGLPPDYPMVAPLYSERRSALAKELGLGRKRTARRPAKGRK